MRSYRLTSNGLSFAVDEAGEGDRVLLLLHGFPQSRIAWHPLMAPLAAMGWRVLAPDLRGYGDSERPGRQSDYRIERLSEDVLAIAEAAGATRPVLVGHDWGGVVAWRTAIDYPERVSGLVVANAPHPAVFERLLYSGLRQRLRSLYVLFFMLPWLPEWQVRRRKGRGLAALLRRQSPAFGQAALEAYAENIMRPGAATAMINYYRANVTRLVTPRTKAPLSVPTLMVWGMADPFLDAALTEGNEAYVPDFTLQCLPGVSHWVLEEAGDRLVAAIEEWSRLKGLAGRHWAP
ncbi:alpha/beta hydrolase [Asticcacaulis sp. DW145]|uniref:Alpha/beta fold hydrolase n=1 Tax=Asticcacaulis currens TaxID=2984210 RepID=A0ABT5IG24_9CAUL|nr:alpha/beta fold hydrolase [Asticcacaulis currens]MDC7695109.1 alpha/beta fold hydrolase [Asticcacaulis currens]BEV12764.1 alpha/beta hydrolase [Asticcacaulis sp. DW145]